MQIRTPFLVWVSEINCDKKSQLWTPYDIRHKWIPIIPFPFINLKTPHNKSVVVDSVDMRFLFSVDVRDWELFCASNLLLFIDVEYLYSDVRIFLCLKFVYGHFNFLKSRWLFLLWLHDRDPLPELPSLNQIVHLTSKHKIIKLDSYLIFRIPPVILNTVYF